MNDFILPEWAGLQVLNSFDRLAPLSETSPGRSRRQEHPPRAGASDAGARLRRHNERPPGWRSGVLHIRLSEVVDVRFMAQEAPPNGSSPHAQVQPWRGQHPDQRRCTIRWTEIQFGHSKESITTVNENVGVACRRASMQRPRPGLLQPSGYAVQVFDPGRRAVRHRIPSNHTTSRRSPGRR